MEHAQAFEAATEFRIASSSGRNSLLSSAGHAATRGGTNLPDPKDAFTMRDSLNGNEHRWGERIPVNIPVQVAVPASPAVEGHLRDLSLSGALMTANREFRLHTVIKVSIKHPPNESGAEIMAQVTRKLKDAVGLEWCEFAPRAVKDLLRSAPIRLPYLQ